MNGGKLQFQSCTFKRTKELLVECGIAKLSIGFDCSDVEWIIDQQGNKVSEIWTYTLLGGPLSYLQL